MAWSFMPRNGCNTRTHEHTHARPTFTHKNSTTDREVRERKRVMKWVFIFWWCHLRCRYSHRIIEFNSRHTISFVLWCAIRWYFYPELCCCWCVPACKWTTVHNGNRSNYREWQNRCFCESFFFVRSVFRLQMGDSVLQLFSLSLYLFISSSSIMLLFSWPLFKSDDAMLLRMQCLHNWYPGKKKLTCCEHKMP